MTVYIDDMNASYKRMKMCHMIADTDDELHAMADAIGVARRWHQAPPKASSSHYDVCLEMKGRALKRGAVPITWRQAGLMTMCRRLGVTTGPLPAPEEARRLYLARHDKPCPCGSPAGQCMSCRLSDAVKTSENLAILGLVDATKA